MSLHGFDAAGARRIVKAVRKVEQMALQPPADTGRPGRHIQAFARITSAGGGGTYSAVEVRRHDNAAATYTTPGRFSNATLNRITTVRELNGDPNLRVGDIVACWIHYTPTGATVETGPYTEEWVFITDRRYGVDQGGAWVEVTSGTGPYSWKQKQPDATTDTSPAVTGSGNLYEVNGFDGYLTGQIVWARSDGTNYRFVHHHRCFLAKLTAESSSGVYSWTELQPNGSTATSRTGTGAQEVHGRTGIPVDTVVLMCQGPGSANFRFVDDSGEPGTVQDKSFTGNHQEAARTSTSWDRASQGSNRGTKRTVCTGVEYNDAGDEILYAYYEDWTFDADGHLVLISEERRENIDTPELCT